MKDSKNIVFDLGGVVVDLAIESALREFAQLGLHPLPTPEKGWGDFGQVIHRMDCGEINTQEFLAILHQRCNPDATDDQLKQAFNSIIRLPRHRLEWLRELRRHYHVYLLSNLSELHWDETQRLAREHGIPVSECFDEVFLSYRLRMAKPDPRIYDRLVVDTGIRPEETLYIDDLPENIAAGKNIGLQTLHIATNTLDEELPKRFPEIL